MKRMSMKLRLSLWFTLILALICALMLSLAASVYSMYERRELRDTLLETVAEETRKIEEERGYIKSLSSNELRESDFLRNAVRLAIYDEDDMHVAGVYLDDEIENLPYSDSEAVQHIEIDGQEYYCCDGFAHIHHGKDYRVRGVVPISRSVAEMLRGHLTILLILPLLLTLAFLGGYCLTGRFLRPIRKIDETMKDIQKSGDLSRRIEFADTGDELSDLAGHINSMFDRLEENFKAERQFTSNASHELRTPVSVILAQCEYGLNNAGDAEELQDVLNAVQKQGHRMSRLIEALLLLTRIEQGTDRYQKEKTDLSQLVRSSCGDFALIADRNIAIRQDIPDGIEGAVNPELFRLMLDNLIQNAIRYGRERGTVEVLLEENEGAILLTVRDDGQGIDKEDLTHIWESFYRADSSRSSKGLGLGLPLVKRIAEFHNGTVSVSSAKGEGSTFCVEISACKPQTALMA